VGLWSAARWFSLAAVLIARRADAQVPRPLDRRPMSLPAIRSTIGPRGGLGAALLDRAHIRIDSLLCAVSAELPRLPRSTSWRSCFWSASSPGDVAWLGVVFASPGRRLAQPVCAEIRP